MRHRPEGIRRRTVITTVVAALAFIALAIVTLGDTQTFDEWVLKLVRTADGAHLPGPALVETFARDLTALGSFPVLLVLTLAMVGFFAIRLEPTNLDPALPAPTQFLAQLNGG